MIQCRAQQTKSQLRDCWVFLVGDKFGPTALGPHPATPVEPPDPCLDTGLIGAGVGGVLGGVLRSGHVLCLSPKATLT